MGYHEMHGYTFTGFQVILLFSTFSYFLGLFLLFSYFFSENSTFSYFLQKKKKKKCLNYFFYQEKLGLQKNALFTLQHIGA